MYSTSSTMTKAFQVTNVAWYQLIQVTTTTTTTTTKHTLHQNTNENPNLAWAYLTHGEKMRARKQAMLRWMRESINRLPYRNSKCETQMQMQMQMQCKCKCKCNAVQCNAMQCKCKCHAMSCKCNAMQCKCHVMQWNVMQCNAMQCNAMQMQCNAM